MTQRSRLDLAFGAAIALLASASLVIVLAPQRLTLTVANETPELQRGIVVVVQGAEWKVVDLAPGGSSAKTWWVWTDGSVGVRQVHGAMRSTRCGYLTTMSKSSRGIIRIKSTGTEPLLLYDSGDASRRCDVE